MRKINYIVVHHTAVDQPNIDKLIKSINTSHKKRWLHKTKNMLWYYIAYHYIMWVNGELKQTRGETEVWFHASNLVINNESIWISLSGNLDKHVPTEKQMEALTRFVINIRSKYWEHIKVVYHNMYAKKTCPGKLFPYALFDKQIAMASKFKEIFQQEVKDPIFTTHDDTDNCTIADAKYLMEIWIARSMKKLYEYIKAEDQKDRSMIQKIFSYLKIK